MSSPPAKFKGSESIWAFLVGGLVFEVAAIISILRGPAGRWPILLVVGTGLVLLALVLGLLRAHRQSPGDGPGAS